ncbi:hypothetical protein CYMTET_19388 [Cymbomonas tetramitiformis]|uniref:polyribonucleotide nucleotidyltransferase n=1 Tax=Cymbomonas tetramitiformis TaxID=36881 RepID=A0AAE0G656_9CHLO|nr:hypothetical protein CYMTET_19388 [Cymbomonas tetramitiformis]
MSRFLHGAYRTAGLFGGKLCYESQLHDYRSCLSKIATPFLGATGTSARGFTATPRATNKILSLPLGASITEEVEIAGRDMIFECGKIARLADGSVVLKYGDTQVLVTAVAERRLQEGNDFMPLSVEYREKAYAHGRLPQNNSRREGVSKDREILIGRAIDRAIRPLFPKGFYYETQIMNHILCADGTQDPDVLCINAASAALMVSDIPWDGPCAAVSVGADKEGNLVLFPTVQQQEELDLNLLYACTEDKALMIEAGASNNGVSEKVFAAALQFAHNSAAVLIAPQRELAARVSKQKREADLIQPSDALLELARSALTPLTNKVLFDRNIRKNDREANLGAARHTAIDIVKEELAKQGEEEVGQVVLGEAMDIVEGELVRRQIREDGVRCDGRFTTEVRPLHAEVGGVPVVHGCSIFNRGDTQAMATTTIASLEDAQQLEAVVGPPTKRFMLHYGFPPFSVNEVGKVGGIGRREIGHGALAEKALAGVMPSEEAYPFTVRVNSETMGSNGSSSMAAVCSGSLALMDAGVPITSHVAGMSIGLLMDSDTVPPPPPPGQRCDPVGAWLFTLTHCIKHLR